MCEGVQARGEGLKGSGISRHLQAFNLEVNLKLLL